MKLIFALALCVNILVSAQDSTKVYMSKNTIQIAFYNVENLFDTIDDKHKLDNEFLPDSKKNWDSRKYQKKLTNLGKVIDAMKPGKYGPDLIGVCEVETKQVVEDLSKDNSLEANKYKVIHFESPDKRGIDVAAMYNGKKLNLVYSENVEVPFPEDGRIKTRDILYTKFVTKKSSDTVHVFFNHWPSRMGGEEKSEWKRIRAAKTLMHKVDSIVQVIPGSAIIIMGDLNDYPTNSSVKEVVCNDSLNGGLQNLMIDYHSNKRGTYNYKGEWGVLDNVIVSDKLLHPATGNSINIYQNRAFIFNKDWLLYTNKKGDKSPAKTMGGSTYYGGYSDHLPVYLLLNY